MTIRVGVIGAAGRMGATVCSAVVADKNLELVAAVDTASAGSVVHGIAVSSELRALADAKVDVAVDFTVAAASRINLPWLAMHNIHAVVGTTGFTLAGSPPFSAMASRRPAKSTSAVWPKISWHTTRAGYHGKSKSRLR